MPLSNYQLSRVRRTGSSEEFRLAREMAGGELDTLCRIVVHLEQGPSTNKRDLSVWVAVGTVHFNAEPNAEVALAVQNLVDNLYSFCYDRDFEIYVSRQWGYFHNELSGESESSRTWRLEQTNGEEAALELTEWFEEEEVPAPGRLDETASLCKTG